MFNRIGASLTTKHKILFLAAMGTGGALYWSSQNSSASGAYVEDCLPSPPYPWMHTKLWYSYDHAAIRRGFQVYNNIGSACHSIKDRYYRQLVNVAYTEEEVKEIAAEHDDYLSEPNDEGDVENRAGVLTDRFWMPYKNDKEARASNNQALPPDLSQIVRGRPGGEDYLFSLLTGYRDPPHGVKLAENMYYNLYFPGGQIAMPPPLAPGGVTYDDGTEASISQMAKDVTIFLSWSSYMEQDERHLMGIKTLTLLASMVVPFLWWKRFRYTLIKKRNVAFLRRNKDFQDKEH